LKRREGFAARSAVVTKTLFGFPLLDPVRPGGISTRSTAINMFGFDLRQAQDFHHHYARV
jgi:hypothetical protein